MRWRSLTWLALSRHSPGTLLHDVETTGAVTLPIPVFPFTVEIQLLRYTIRLLSLILTSATCTRSA
jgi:hypothetical protein